MGSSATSSSEELTTASTVPDTKKYDSLVEWLQQSKEAEISSKIMIQPSSRGGGYGAFVTSPVEQDELLFRIPRSACITMEDAMTDEACGKMFKTLIDKAGPGGNTVVMAGFMAKEQLKALHDAEEGKETSSFGPYLATLPWERGVNNQEHIIFWSDEDIESYLKGSMCYSEANSLREEVDYAITVLDAIMGKSIQLYRGEIEDGFKWPWEVQPPPEGPVKGLSQAVKGAFVSLLTRAFQDGDDDEEKFVPLLDMLQHSDDPNVSHAMRKDDGSVEVRAIKALSQGDELLNQYRSEREETMPYHRFFTRFGFVPGVQEDLQNLLQDKSSIFFAQKAEV